MNKSVRSMLMVMILAVVGMAGSTAFGDHGCHGLVNSHAYGNGMWPYTLGHVPVPPYFALHPPVYYSLPVARPYGHSPYPLPGTAVPELPTVHTAVEITNPFVAPAREDSVASAPQFSPPQFIMNPYFNGGDAPSAALAQESKESGR